MSKKRYRYVGSYPEARACLHSYPIPECIYNEDARVGTATVKFWVQSNNTKHEWEEVFDEVKTPPCVGHAIESDKEEKALRYNDGKPQWSLVHFKSLEPFVRVLEYGAHKYSVFEKPDGTIINGSECTPQEALNYKLISSGRDNWKKNMVLDKILDSSQRHIAAMIDGEENDLESKLQHAGHVICNMMFYIYHNNNIKNG